MAGAGGEWSGAPVSLPVFRTSLVGRDAEIAELVAWVGRARLVTVTGVGGAGKTRLAVAAAATAGEAVRFPSGVSFVDLSPVTRPDLVAETVAGVVAGGLGGGAANIEDWLVGYLAPRRALIVLDNCEHLTDACAALVDRILNECAEMRVLATSREPLRIDGEQVWPIPPLAVEAAGNTVCEAVELFAARARGVRPDFVLTDTNTGVLAELCRHLDGLPLAIELAAAQVAVLSPTQLVERLGDRLQLLRVGPRQQPARHQTLAAAIGWSYELLGADEQAVFRRLSVFTGSFSLEAAEGICAVSDGTPVVELLARLVAASLVAVEPGTSANRYRLLETIRLYATARLAETGDADGCRDAHRDWYLAWLETFDLDQALYSIPMSDMVSVEVENLRAAMDWSQNQGRWELAARMALWMTGMYLRTERHDEGASRLEQLARRPELGAGLRASCITAGMMVAMIAGRSVNTSECFEAVEVDPDAPLTAQALTNSAIAAYGVNPAEGRRLVALAEAHPRCTPGMRRYARGFRVGFDLIDQCVSPTLQTPLPDSVKGLGELMEGAEPGGDTNIVYHAVAIAHLMAGDPRAALEHNTDLALGGPFGRVWAGGIAGVAHAQLGDFAAARARLSECGHYALETSFPRMITVPLTGFAALAFHQADGAKAARLLESAIHEDGLASHRTHATAALFYRYQAVVAASLDPALLAAERAKGRLISASAALRAEVEVPAPQVPARATRRPARPKQPQPAASGPGEGPVLLGGRYELKEEVGSGSQARVWRAFDHQHGRDVALKIRPGGDREELLAEARILLGLRPHAGLPVVRDDFFAGDEHVTVMDWVEGPNLARVLAERGDPGLAPTVVLGYLEQLAGALDHLHAHQPPVVHGDVKPANAILTPDRRVVLVDFGSAGTRVASGPTGYVAPEVAAGQRPTPAADVYGLAATAVALLTGEPPVAGRPAWEGLDPNVVGGLERGLRRGLAVDPSRRPGGAGELVERLRSALAGALPSGVVTFLLTDIENSTVLWDTHPAAMGAVIAATETLIADSVEARGGRLIKSRGEGDSTMSVFIRASDAAATAVELQQRLGAHRWPEGITVALRVALHTGEAELREGDYYGGAVNRAARLRALTAGGQIVCSAATAQLIADHLPAGAALTALGQQRLRGLSRAETVHALVLPGAPHGGPAAAGTDEAGEPGGVALPAPLQGIPPAGLVGRAGERDLLAAAFRAVVDGDGQRVMIVGAEAGQGKTTLVADAARLAHGQGAVVLYGRADEELGVPYQPFLEALGHYVANAPGGWLAGHDPDRLADLARLVPGVRARLPALAPAVSTDPDAERWMVFGAVATVFAELSRRAPVVVVLDDLHWADRSSLLLLRHLARAHMGRVLVLGTYRDNELTASHPLTDTLAALHREPCVQRLALSGLADDEVVELVEATAGQSLDQTGIALAHTLHRDTDGNPFFVGELLRHLAETGAITREETGGWRVSADLSGVEVPGNVREVIGARVERLGGQTRVALSAAAVVGQEFDVELVATVSGISEASLLDLLDPAEDAAIVVEVADMPGRFRFAHALIQRSIYAELGVTRQARLHRQVAEALEVLCGADPGARIAERARHWLAVRPPTAKAVISARQAGGRALAMLAPSEAIRWYGEALGALARAPDEQERARCLAGLGEAQRLVGDPVYRETLLEAARVARAIGDVDTLVSAALANNRGWWSAAGEVDTERVAGLEAALGMLPTGDSIARARLLALLALELSSDADYPARRRWADEALAIARRLGDPATIVDVFCRRVGAIAAPDTTRAAYAELVEAERVADQLGDRVAKFWVLTWRVVGAAAIGDGADVRRCIAEEIRLAAEVGQPILRWAAAYDETWVALLDGDVDRAEALANETLQLATDTGQPDALTMYGSQLFGLRSHQGRLAEVVDLFAPAAADAPGSVYRALLAEIYAEIDRDDHARSMLDDERSAGFPGPDGLALPAYLTLWTGVAAHLGDQASAEVLYDRLAQWPDLVVLTYGPVLGAVAHSLAILASVIGRYETAGTHFQHALDIHESLAAPCLIAGTRLEWGRMLLARAHPEDDLTARNHLESARDMAHRHGCARVEQRAVDLLSQR